MQYFWITLQIVCGIITPVAFYVALIIIKDSIESLRDSVCNSNFVYRINDTNNWKINNVSRCPNEDYIKFDISNKYLDKRITLAVEKVLIKDVL